MLHRATWIAGPIVALVVVGAGLGWWGYDQSQQRQSLALQSENQYAGSFHGLVADVHSLHQELGKSIITSDEFAFQQHLRNVWRLSYAAQNQVARLPVSLMPMHSAQSFLTSVSQDASRWMDSNANPTDPNVRKTEATLFAQSNDIYHTLANLQSKVVSGHLQWATVTRDLQSKKATDNQIIDGFHMLDKAATAFVESDNGPSSLLKRRTDALNAEPSVSTSVALERVRNMLKLPKNTQLDVAQTGNGAKTPEYIVRGNEKQGFLFASVSKHGGHVISFQRPYHVAAGHFDIVQSTKQAQTWLQNQGFKDFSLTSVHAVDSQAYLTFAPNRNGAVIQSQGIALTVSMLNHQIVGFDANNYYFHPAKDIPRRNYSVEQLRRKLNPAFTVGETKEVIVTDERNGYQPAVAFYGVANHETYCVYMNANTGREMYIEQLTQH